MARIPVALIVDDLQIAEWQAAALADAAPMMDVRLILNCGNTRHQRQYVRHFGYFCLNLASLRNRMTRSRRLRPGDADIHNFDAEYEGAWQKLPAATITALREAGVTAVIKFGMGLLRIDPEIDDIPLLSFHHGDPAHYRGRPAGFYELLHNEDKAGVIVQQLSNTLDAGRILALGYACLSHHSYRQSASQFYAISRHLLRKALQNLDQGNYIEHPVNGRNYRLPGNLLALRFVLKLLWRKVIRLGYGMLIEKKWQVATTTLAPDLTPPVTVPLQDLQVAPLTSGYTFLADPFFSTDGKLIRAEALRATTGLGDIVSLDAQTLQLTGVELSGAHYSYPFSFDHDGKEYLLPEVASHSSPRLFEISGTYREASTQPLPGLEAERIVDPTLHIDDSGCYLFGGDAATADNILRLFFSESITAPFHEHPASPIVIDPAGARMAGAITTHNGQLVRYGQDNSRGYGRSIRVFAILHLGPEEYAEEYIGSVAMEDAYGPHTINHHGTGMVLDFYHERLSLLAGYRRLIARLAAR